MQMTFKHSALAIALSLISSQASMLITPTQSALADTYQAGISHRTTQAKTYFQTHPKVKKAAIGAGVGTAAGAAVGLLSGKGALRGAAIGAGTGATVGAISGSKTMKAHPYMKDMAMGTLSGAGLSLAMNKGHGKGKRVVEGAALGAAVGLGAGFLKKEFH